MVPLSGATVGLKAERAIKDGYQLSEDKKAVLTDTFDFEVPPKTLREVSFLQADLAARLSPDRRRRGDARGAVQGRGPARGRPRPERPDELAVLDELGGGLRMRGGPGREVQLELRAHVVVPHRRGARNLDSVRGEPIGDVIALGEERDQAVEVGEVLDSDFHVG